MEEENTFDYTKSVNINRNVLFSRQIYLENDKDNDYAKSCARGILHAAKKKFSCSNLMSFFPFLIWLRSYNWKKHLKDDVFSGITVACVNIPQGLASSLIIGVRPEYGIYTSCYQPLIYFIFGESPHLAIGTFLTLSILCSSTVMEYSVMSSSTIINETWNATQDVMELGPTPEEVSVSLAMAIGLWLILFSIVGFGHLSTILSEQFMQGLINGVCVILFSSQLKGILGIKVQRHFGAFSNIMNLWSLMMKLPKTNLVTLGLSAAAFVLHYTGNKLLNERYKHKIKIYIPMELIVVILTTIVSQFLHLNADHAVSVIGGIPHGFSMPKVPCLTILPSVLIDGLLIAILLFALTHCYNEYFSRTYGTRRVSPNQELLAFGMMNVVGSFFSCFPGGAAFSRSKVQAMSGGKTQITSVVSSIMLLFVISFLGPVLYSLPKCILSMMIMVSVVKSVLNVAMVKQLWRNSKLDLLVYLFVYVTTICVSVNHGMVLGICFSLLILIFKMFRTETESLQPYNDTEIYIEKSQPGPDDQNTHVPILRFNGSLNFISRNKFKHIIERKIMEISTKNECSREIEDSGKMEDSGKIENSGKMENGDSKRSSLPSIKEEAKEKVKDEASVNLISNKNMDLIISFTSVAFIDYSGLETLKEVQAFAKRNSVNLHICCCSESVYCFLKKSDFVNDFCEERMYASVHDAVCFVKNKN